MKLISFTMLESFPVHTPVRTHMYGFALNQSDRMIPPVFQSAYYNAQYSDMLYSLDI